MTSDLGIYIENLSLDVFDILKSIKDPERPETLEELGVINECDIKVHRKKGPTSNDTYYNIKGIDRGVLFAIIFLMSHDRLWLMMFFPVSSSYIHTDCSPL